MVHITENGQRLYTYSTRREAFSILLQLERERPQSTFTIVPGKETPHHDQISQLV